MATPTTLYEYYTSKGQALPSVSARSSVAKQAGISNYSGTASQNNQLLSYLLKGSSSSKSTAQKTTPASKTSTVSSDTEKEIAKQKKDAEDRLAKQTEKQQKAIARSFDPIFDALDEQFSSFGSEKGAYERQVGEQAGYQRNQAKAALESNLASLEESKAAEEANAQASLRNLEADIRNQLKSQSQYFGTIGAGDSSAAGALSEAIQRAGLKSRADILSTRDAAFGDLEKKKADLNSLAAQENAKVDQWKSDKLFEISQFFSQKLDSLRSQRANATAEKQRAIENTISGLQNQFYSTLQQLDTATLNYKSSIENWAMQRAADLEDYGTKLAMAAKYQKSGDNAVTYNSAVNTFNNLVASGVDAGAARTAVKNQTGVDPLGGLELTEEQLNKIKEKPDFFEQLADTVAATNAETSAPTNQGAIPNWIPLIGGF